MIMPHLTHHCGCQLDRQVKTGVLSAALGRVLGLSTDGLLAAERIPVPGPGATAGVLSEMYRVFESLKPNSAGIITGKSLQRVVNATSQFDDLNFSAALRGQGKGTTKKLSWDAFSEGLVEAVASSVPNAEERQEILRNILCAISSA